MKAASLSEIKKMILLTRKKYIVASFFLFNEIQSKNILYLH